MLKINGGNRPAKSMTEAPTITLAINGFFLQGGVTMIGALPGHKTLVALSMAKALLEGKPLFGHFHTPRKSDRILYLIPESSLSPFAARLKDIQTCGLYRRQTVLSHVLVA